MASHITLEDAVDRLGPVPQDIRRAMELIKDLDKQARAAARPTDTNVARGGRGSRTHFRGSRCAPTPSRCCSGWTSLP